MWEFYSTCMKTWPYGFCVLFKWELENLNHMGQLGSDTLSTTEPGQISYANYVRYNAYTHNQFNLKHTKYHISTWLSSPNRTNVLP